MNVCLNQCAGVIFTAGSAGTSGVCTNGTGITLTDTSQQFPISNLSVTFVGTETTNATSSGASGSAIPSSSSTGSGKSGAGTVLFDYRFMVLMLTLAIGGLAIGM